MLSEFLTSDKSFVTEFMNDPASGQTKHIKFLELHNFISSE